MNSKTRTNTNLVQLKDIFKQILPENKTEILILIISVLLYSSYSFFIATNTSVIDNKDVLYDVYFSFDNPVIFRRGYIYIDGHPLMMFITKPFIYLGNMLASVSFEKAKTIFIAFLCSMLISLSTVYVYRYLKKIVEIKSKFVFLLLIFYTFSSTNLILSFTPESFTISAFLLSFVLYIYSDCIKNERSIGLVASTILTVSLGGITITNFSKGIIPVLFLHESWKLKICKIFIPTLILLLILAFWQTQFDLIYTIGVRVLNELKIASRGTYVERVFDWFYASPIFFPDIIFTEKLKAIELDFYRYWWQYFFSLSILVLLLASFFSNYKNKLVIIMGLFFLQDITIHAIIKYGLRDPFIFGGHWVFLVPLCLGWLYKSINNKIYQKMYISFMGVLCIFLIINNSIQLYNFIELAIKHFPEPTL